MSTVAHSLFLTVTFEYRESVTPKHCILWRAFPVNSQTNNTTITFFCHIFYFFSECFYSASIFFYISCQHFFILFSLCQLRSIIFYVFNRNFYFFLISMQHMITWRDALFRQFQKQNCGWNFKRGQRERPLQLCIVSSYPVDWYSEFKLLVFTWGH